MLFKDFHAPYEPCEDIRSDPVEYTYIHQGTHRQVGFLLSVKKVFDCYWTGKRVIISRAGRIAKGSIRPDPLTKLAQFTGRYPVKFRDGCIQPGNASWYFAHPVE